jgi:hypothetical protein
MGTVGRPRSYVLKKYKFAADAADHLSKLVDPPASGTSEHITVDGKQLLRKLWDEAMKLSQVSAAQATAVPPRTRMRRVVWCEAARGLMRDNEGCCWW